MFGVEGDSVLTVKLGAVGKGSFAFDFLALCFCGRGGRLDPGVDGARGELELEASRTAKEGVKRLCIATGDHARKAT